MPLAVIGLAASPALATAPGFASLDAIDAQVSAFAGGMAAPVDRRLKLAVCVAPLVLSWPGARRDTVLVRCPDPGSWRLYVPVVGGVPVAEAEAPAVQRGEAVTVTVRGDGFSVSQPGEALEPGAIGAWIRVRPGDRKDAVRAQVVRPGLVEIPAD
ncbi:MAG: flagella basal body P-ring formation protein FlgA [Sphingomonadales bacterium]|nr:flagella basal body P-ring formation protein FlgA [Sphingomonadales bacterium]MDE2569021.1 flagella basal body P-ring formation protein FlgA [Sphingomonadales bacterium]